MSYLRSALGASASLGTRMALSSMAVDAVQAPAARMPWTLAGLQSRIAACTLLRSSRSQAVRNHFSATLPRPATHESAWGFSAGSALGFGAAIGGIGYLCGGDAPGGATVALTAAMLLNVSILIHEAGHLAAARALGVAVREFSVGIGPRVAWWQGATTTYSLRAVPLLGFVSFLTAKEVEAAVGSNAHAANGMYGGGGGGGAPRLLASLSPGRRALVMAAGVAANVALAAAFIVWQVMSYGEMDVVVQPGARIKRLGGWSDDGVDGDGQNGDDRRQATARVPKQRQQQQQQQPAPGALRLQEGDVVIAVGQRRLPAGGALDEAIVSALRAAVVRPQTPAKDASDDACTDSGKLLEGVEMTVLRCRTAARDGGNEGGDSLLGAGSIALQLNAADLLRYETLVVAPNFHAGYRAPADIMETLTMSGQELSRVANAVLQAWSDLLASAIGGSGTYPQCNTSTLASGSSGSSSSGSSSSSSRSSKGPQFVGPLGVVASAAEYMAAEAGRTGNSSISSSTSVGSSEAAAMQPDDDVSAAGVLTTTQQRGPHPLLGLGVQLNLQLALFNLLPLPVLDGGQLLLVALEAVRGRRMPALVERLGLLGSMALLGGWLLALSVRDVVGLADKAVERLAASLESYSMYGNHHSYPNHNFNHQQQQEYLSQHYQQQQQQRWEVRSGGRSSSRSSSSTTTTTTTNRVGYSEQDFSGAAAAAVA